MMNLGHVNVSFKYWREVDVMTHMPKLKCGEADDYEGNDFLIFTVVLDENLKISFLIYKSNIYIYMLELKASDEKLRILRTIQVDISKC